MDYKTTKLSRKHIRILAKVIRQIFKECIYKEGLYVDVVKMFELVHSKFKNITTEIVPDEKLKDIPGECIPDYNGNYHIRIKETVYVGAISGVGGYRVHILHELSHAFLCIAGYAPISQTQYKNGELKAYESMEWQAKALAGEILMEYALTKEMTTFELMHKCGVSIDSARNRRQRSNGGDAKRC